MPRVYSRNLRVASEMQRVLNELLMTAVKDPRLAGVSVSEVEVSGDLGVATVFYSTLGVDDKDDDVDEAFEKARGFLRSRVAQALDLRRAPELRFRHDTSAARALELGRLIDSSVADRGRDPDDEPS
jgi:ribosome-binding factor A